MKGTQKIAVRSKKKIMMRKTKFSDYEAIKSITERVYPGLPPYSQEAFRAQLNHFPEGQFVVEYEDQVVGFCISFMITEELAFKDHTWKEITGSGFASRHDPKGDYLYGMEVCVDPDYQGRKVGERLYNERKNLCQNLGLKGIVFAGRMPGLKKRSKKYPTPELYLEDVKTKKIKDPTISFQISNDFEPIKVLHDYLPSDAESMGHAALMKWSNPHIDKFEESGIRYKIDHSENVRICTLNYEQRSLKNFEEFKNIIEYFVGVASDYSCDFILFPEFVTMPLLSIENEELPPAQAMDKLDEYTNDYVELMSQLSIRYNINIIGGTHITKKEDGLYNICYVFLRDGSIHEQEKIHPTPSEVYWWNIKGGNKLPVINTDKGAIGILTCYDSEFPEMSRHLVDQGAKILFVPFATDTRQGYLRVRVCAQARAIENQCYVVLAGNVGNLPRVHNMDINYAQSCIITPSDFPFARDGIAADTDPNVEMVAVADLSLMDLIVARNEGSVQNLKDRRHDLYRVDWKTQV